MKLHYTRIFSPSNLNFLAPPLPIALIKLIYVFLVCIQGVRQKAKDKTFYYWYLIAVNKLTIFSIYWIVYRKFPFVELVYTPQNSPFYRGHAISFFFLLLLIVVKIKNHTI